MEGEARTRGVGVGVDHVLQCDVHTGRLARSVFNVVRFIKDDDSTLQVDANTLADDRVYEVVVWAEHDVCGL